MVASSATRNEAHQTQGRCVVTGGAGGIDEPAEPWGAAAGDLVRAAATGETAACEELLRVDVREVTVRAAVHD